MLVGRRLAEAGVPLVTAIWDCTQEGPDIATLGWDTHWDHFKACEGWLLPGLDRALSALLDDLHDRGMLDETLVVWTTEFGRTPGEDGPSGRGHHGACFSSWLAGGGAKGGVAYGQTDEIGATVAENMVHVHDFHATILHLLGIDHTKLTYRHAGRDFRLTDVGGHVVQDIVA